MLTDKINNTPIGNDLEKAKEYVRCADLSSVEQRLIFIDNWPKKLAVQATQEYRNYLYLRKKYPDHILPPSYEIDEAWHAHVLHTKEYTKFCQEFFGYYLHHDPHVMDQKGNAHQLVALFERTQELYKKEFDDFLYQYKRRPLHIRRMMKKYLC